MSEPHVDLKDGVVKFGDEPLRVAPPLGLTPKWVRDLQRAFEIIEAMGRYVEQRKKIPHAWIQELTALNDSDSFKE